ncbi:MAG TPA: class I SAM-dependent methyltransferase [Gemmatimonadaceae bacterium]|nr:class I SAM-dependent methyltransferase [Gemmatimonadaceae bacterium]
MPDGSRTARKEGEPDASTAGGEDHLELRLDVARYYADKINTFGANPRGVDWNSRESQELRFEQLLRLIPAGAADFTVLDYGCGYGALVGSLSRRYDHFRYQGFDLADAMIERARELHAGDRRCRFTTDPGEIEQADYVIASGVLNVKLQHSVEEWTAYFATTLQELARLATRGFAFNALTSYSDRERQRTDLYYADPLVWFDHCKRRYSRFVTLLHDYELYEFTMLVTRDTDRRQ